ncbi:MAG: hypothetical protein DWH91_00060 [Planctomycetota bacterium]|nr:MAG: hypothetical protein DWH91_00060 [Planctomycetota bacterium]
MIDFVFTMLLFAYGLALLLAILIPLWNRFFVVAFVMAIASTASAAVSDAVVLVDDCSGVCVDPTGLVLTAKHCDHPPVVVVRFKDRTVSARRVYVCPETEGPVVFDCDGDGFPFARLAEIVPPNGEKVWSAGYPDLAGRRELRWASGPMLGGSNFRYQGGAFRGNVVGFSTGPGWSGGPLFNQHGEVCGLLDSSDCQTSVFITYAATREAYVACRHRPATKPTLYVFGSVHCGPCLKFKQHYAEQKKLQQRLDSRFTVVFVDIDVHTGTADQFGIKEVPAFVVPGEPTITGYTEPDVLLGKLGVAEQEPEPPAIVDAPPKPPVVTPPPVIAEPAAEPTAPVTVTVEKPPVAPPTTPAVEKPDRSVADRLDRLSGLVQTGVSIATWLGVGGMTGGAGGLVLGGLALWRTLRRRRIAASARDSPAAMTASPTPKPPFVTVESPPPPQAIVTETRFAPYERDTFAEAFAWAEAELVRKYPGSVSTLEAMKGLINQFLSAKGVKPKS